ncbi:dUTP diphosphatase [Patescibacteria group bacterium]|nr:dUTP diphosphatase [Patescibacteria group bacterium]
MLIKIKKMYPDAKIPQRATPGAVGYDVYAYHPLDKESREPSGDLPIEIPPGGSVLFGTGVHMAVPMPVDCQVRPRSGLANKYDIELSNSPGTIDPDYRGEASILLRNRGDRSFTVEKGMRIAQLVFSEVTIPELLEVEDLSPTSRDTGGFGSTGLHEVTLGDAEYRAEQARWDRYFMRVAFGASELSNCIRGVKCENGRYPKDEEGRYVGATRRFGCVIICSRNIVAQGFNRRTDECSEELGCVRDRESIPTGTALEWGCLHAEQVAIQNHARTGGPPLKEATVYVNAEPCVMCAKLLLGCGIAAVVVPEGVYPTNGLKLLLDSGIEIRRVTLKTA